MDKFYTVPPGGDPNFVDTLLEITEREQIDVVFPESSVEVPHLAKRKADFEAIGVPVLVSESDAIAAADNKAKMYEVLAVHSNGLVNIPRYLMVNSLDEFIEAANSLGYPDSPICFKPPVGKGSRGFRVIDPHKNRRTLLLEEKPSSRYISFDEAVRVLGEGDFPSLMMMEFLDGEEVTADSICLNGDEGLTAIKSVEEERCGVIVQGTLLDRPDILQQAQAILRTIPLSYCVNIQFVGDRLIEINPRVSSFIYQDDLIFPYLAVKLALKETTIDELRKLGSKIKIGRKMVRYMDQIFYDEPAD